MQHLEEILLNIELNCHAITNHRRKENYFLKVVVSKKQLVKYVNVKISVVFFMVLDKVVSFCSLKAHLITPTPARCCDTNGVIISIPLSPTA